MCEQFCQDYTLKSTALLTAIEVGEIFLNVVPLQSEFKYLELGMNFDMFQQVLIYLAMVAFRDCGPEIEPQYKVKALLLYMWKAVNNTAKTKQFAQGNDRSNDMFGCSLFSDTFLSHWGKEGFPEYTQLRTPTGLVGRDALLATAATADMTGSGKPGTCASGDNEDADEVKSVSSIPSTASRANTSRKLKTVDEGSFLGVSALNTAIKGTNIQINFDLPTSNPTIDLAEKRPVDAPGILRGRDLTTLFRNKPDLVEFLLLEIDNMKLYKSLSKSSAAAEDFNKKLISSPITRSQLQF